MDLTTAIGDTLIERIAATVLDTIHEAASGSRSGLLVTALGPKHEKVLRHAFGARCGHGVFGTLNRRWPPAPG